MEIQVNHYRMADISIYHGVMVLGTGVLLLIARYYRLSPDSIRALRLIHVVLGVLTSIYGLLTYLITP